MSTLMGKSNQCSLTICEPILAFLALYSDATDGFVKLKTDIKSWFKKSDRIKEIEIFVDKDIEAALKNRKNLH